MREYIQATSRVGRDPKRPGLVVTMLNVHKPRDRSHYERFEVYHETFYRAVEATSVTPFSPRALDRGLAGTLVALARQKGEGMTPPKGASEILTRRQSLEWVANALADRAAQACRSCSERRLKRRRLSVFGSVSVQTTSSIHGSRSLTTTSKRPSPCNTIAPKSARPNRYFATFSTRTWRSLPRVHWKFRANRSMRDVEPSVNVLMRTLDRPDDDVELPEESS